MNGGGVTPSPTPYVDLGLPSGLLWCRFNVGASAPEEKGLFFSWGNIDGHAEDSGYDFSQEVYDGTPGAALSGNIPLSHDAAHVNLGGAWRMPTNAEFQELFDSCTSEWTSINGVIGRLLTSRFNGRKLFLPAAGCYNGLNFVDPGTRGYIWTSTFTNTATADRALFDSSTMVVYHADRHYGFNVRAVLDR